MEEDRVYQPVDPALFIREANPRTVVITAFDEARGTAILSAGVDMSRIDLVSAPRSSFIHRSVQVDLTTGRLSALPKQAAKKNNPGPDVCASPNGKYSLHFNENTETVTLVDSKQKTIAEITETEFPGLDDITWSPTGECFTTVSDGAPDENPKAGLNVYFPDRRNSQLLVHAKVAQPRWSANGRFLSCIQVDTAACGQLPTRVRQGHGTLLVFDPSKGFRRILSKAEMAYESVFSPSEDRIAFLEVAKDEYDDYSNDWLKVVDVTTDTVRPIATSRRKIDFIWAGDDALAAVTYDKWAVPSLSMIDVTSGKRTVLLRDSNCARITPVRFLQGRNILIYTTNEIASGEQPDHFWSIMPGGKPVRLFPPQQKNGVQ